MDGLKLRVFFIAVFFFSFVFSEQSWSVEFRRTLSMEFDPVEGATSYEIEARNKFDSKDKSPKVFKTTTPVWNAKLKPGRYQFRLRTLDARSVPGPWSEYSDIDVLGYPLDMISPTDNEAHPSEDKDEAEILFSWTPIENVKSYKVQIQKVAPSLTDAPTKTPPSQRETQILIEKITSDTKIKISIPPAQSYTWTVVATDSRGIETEPQNPPRRFRIIGLALESPVWLKPEINDAKELNLLWKPSMGAEKYLLTMKRKTKNGWSKPRAEAIQERSESIKEMSYKIPIRDGIYHASLSAHHPLHLPTPELSLYFEIRNNQVIAWGNDEGALETDRIYPRQNSYWGLFHLVSASYSGSNSNYNSFASFEEAAGPGVTFGWQGDGLYKSFGGFLSYSYKTFTAAAAINEIAINTSHLLALARSPIRERPQSRLHLVYGGFYDEAAEILGDSTQTQLSAQYLRVAGPALGIQWERQFAQLWRFSLLFTLKQQSIALQTPSDAELNKQIDGHIDLRFDRTWNSKNGLVFGVSSGGGSYSYPGAQFDFNNGGFYLGWIRLP